VLPLEKTFPTLGKPLEGSKTSILPVSVSKDTPSTPVAERQEFPKNMKDLMDLLKQPTQIYLSSQVIKYVKIRVTERNGQVPNVHKHLNTVSCDHHHCSESFLR
jgi:hypothetical protein